MGSYRVNKLIAVPLSPGHAHSVLARGSTLHVRAYDCIPLQSQYSHVLLTYLQQVFPVHNNKLFRSAWTLSERDTTSENPSSHHHHTMSHRPIIAAHDPRTGMRTKTLVSYQSTHSASSQLEMAAYEHMHVPHVFPTQTFFFRRAPRYALDQGDLVVERLTSLPPWSPYLPK
jgi:hypothetical protein